MKKWHISPKQDNNIYELSSALGLAPLTVQILLNRGITQIENFINPKLNFLQDPFLIPNIKKGAERVLLAKTNSEKVTVYGDYDVDGVTGTAILVLALRHLGIKADYYIPHRYGEGYSLSLESVKKISENGTKLIITVDCGISSAIEVEEANALGMAVIVTDHHNLPQTLPKAAAIVNPKQISGDHPSKYLSGAGVAFKFAWALLRTAEIKDSIFLTSLLDLASLGTFSDVVPLTGENRILAVGGLKLINEKKRLGLKLLAEAAGLTGEISANKIYFALAPRLNAAGRLEHAAQAVELLLADDPVKAREMANGLSKINSRRQDIGAEIKESVFSQIDEKALAGSRMIILSGEKWHPGVIGIVASKIAETYNRPTVLIGINEGIGRGSARSVKGVNVFEILNACRDLFLDFGGHEGAAGFEIAAENIPELRRRLAEEAAERIKPEDLSAIIEIDAEIEPKQINLNLIRELEKLAPFGEGNQEPVLMMRHLQLTSFKTVGKDGKHLKAWFSGEGIELEGIGFRLGENGYNLTIGKNYDVVFNLQGNEYNGFEKAQLSLIDLREAQR